MCFALQIKYAYGLSGFSGPVWAVESCAEGGADIMPLPHLSCIDYARTSSCEPRCGCCACLCLCSEEIEYADKRLVRIYSVVIISRSLLITADVILIFITWISLWRRVVYVSGKHTRLSFTKVLLRDGAYSNIIPYPVLCVSLLTPSSICLTRYHVLHVGRQCGEEPLLVLIVSSS